MNKPYTIDINTEAQANVEMIDPLPAGTELNLIKYRVRLDLTTIPANIPDVLYISLGNACSSNNIVDNIKGSYKFPIALDNRFIDSTTNMAVTFSSGDNVPLTLVGQLDSAYTVRVFYKNGTEVPYTVLKHLFLQFRYN